MTKDIVDSIADNLLQDHISLMTENKLLRAALVDVVENSTHLNSMNTHARLYEALTRCKEALK